MFFTKLSRILHRIKNPQNLEDCFLPFSKFGKYFFYLNYTVDNGQLYVTRNDRMRYVFANFVLLSLYISGLISQYHNLQDDVLMKYEVYVMLTLGTFGSIFGINLLMYKRLSTHAIVTTLQKVHNDVKQDASFFFWL